MLTSRKRREADEIKHLVEKKFKGIISKPVNMKHYSKGSDYIGFIWYIDDDSLPQKERLGTVLYNTDSGHFSVYTASNEKHANHLSTELYDVMWYKELIKILYAPIPNTLF